MKATLWNRQICLVLMAVICACWLCMAQEPGDNKGINIKNKTTGTLDRVALVIGNAAYEKVSPLKNTLNDAQDMRDALSKLGFEVIYRENATKAEMESGLAELTEKSVGKEVVFYYSGHGMQIAEQNYLLPVGVKATSKNMLKLSSIDMGTVLTAMSDGKIKIVILDACRDNPFASADKNVGRGLAEMKEKSDETLVIYATEAGGIASDNPSGRNGLFTQCLLEYMQKEGMEIVECMREVTREVREKSKKTQTPQNPCLYISMVGKFYFKTEVTTAQMDLELKISAIGKKVSYQVIAQNLGAEGQVNMKLIFPVGMKSKNKEWPLQWPNQTFQSGESKKFSYKEFEAATPGNFEVICRAEQNKKIIAEVKKQINIEASVFTEESDAARRQAELAALTEAKRKAEAEAKRQADLLAQAKLKAELAELQRQAEVAEAQRKQAELLEAQRQVEAKRQADIAEAQRQAEIRRLADLQAQRDLQAERDRQAAIEAQRRRDEEAARQQRASSSGVPSGFTYLGEQTYSCAGITNRMKEYRHNQTGLEFVLIPGGTFQMGSNDGDSDEKPVHQVTLSPYLISKTEVTQGVWRKIMGNNPSYFPKGDDHPVEQVSWDDCQSFCQKTGLKLPSEAQWEFAARGGSTTRYYFGNSESELGNYGWYSSNSGSSTHPVVQKSPNAYGLYDVAGNVWEWCQDWYGTYSSGSVTNPVGANSGQYRVLRGGSWCSFADVCRSAFRGWGVPGYRRVNFGFRCVFFQFQ